MSEIRESLAKAVAKINKVGGLGFISKASDKFTALDRVPTGIFKLDLAMGGGFPVGRASCMFGPESVGKTNLYLKTIALYQQRNPGMRVAFIDIEGCFDVEWAAKFGVNVEDLYLVRPTTAEEVVDFVHMAMSTSDCGLLVLDSIGALIGEKELANDASREQVGGNSRIMAKFCTKVIAGFIAAEKEGRVPTTVLLVNQTRTKIGVMFGNPEGMPGGQAFKHLLALTIRVGGGKNIIEKAVNPTMPVAKEMRFSFKKWKCKIFSTAAEAHMITIAHKGFGVGETANWKTALKLMREVGWVVQDKTWQVVHPETGEVYECKTLDEVKSTSIEKIGNGDEQAVYDILIRHLMADPDIELPESG